METFQSDMCSEFKRYATFNGFQTPPGVLALQLAQAGFYRSSNLPGVPGGLFRCGLSLDVRNVRTGSVMEIHRRLAPTCSFVSGSANNQPVPAVDPRSSNGIARPELRFRGVWTARGERAQVSQWQYDAYAAGFGSQRFGGAEVFAPQFARAVSQNMATRARCPNFPSSPTSTPWSSPDCPVCHPAFSEVWRMRPLILFSLAPCSVPRLGDQKKFW